MTNKHVLSALTKKKALLLGEVKYYASLLKQSEDNLAHIDKAILLFDDTYDLESIQPKRVHAKKYFKTGEARILILDILRTSNSPVSTNKVAIKIASDKNLENEEKHFNIERFYKIVLASLTRCEESGLIERIGREGRAILWQIKRD
jgi:hypothetical protein